MGHVRATDSLANSRTACREPCNRETGPNLHRIRLRVSASADSATLLRLVSVIHSRGSAVVDLHYTRNSDGTRELTATVLSLSTRFATLIAALGRVVHVLDVISEDLNQPYDHPEPL